MNKVKMAFIAIAILTAVGGAFATNSCVQCEHSIQYYFNGGGYQQAGEFGNDYDCYVTGGTCTYYKPDPIGQPNVYAPCHIGAYTPL
jgi:hypothetical protein